MGYGKKVKDNKPSVGMIDDCTIDSDLLLTVEDMNGTTTAYITFNQPDGSSVTSRIWDSEEEKEQDRSNAWINHIASEIIGKEEYEAAVEGATGFVDFVNRVNQVVGQAYKGETYRMLFHYNKKNFVTTPLFAPFFETMNVTEGESRINKLLKGTGKSSLYIKKFLVLQDVPEADAEEAPATTSTGSGENLPF